MIKLVVCDLDGTLLNENSEISDKTKITIKKLTEMGINFAIASGRSVVSVTRFRNELGIRMYFICNNGANIYNESGDVIFSAPMEDYTVEKIVKFLIDRNINYNGFDENNIYIHSLDSGRIVSLENKYFSVKEIIKMDYYPKMSKLLAKGEPDVILKAKEQMLKEDFAKDLDITISQPFCLDVVDKNATKGDGVKLLARNLGISTDEIMAFGDGDNDLNMLESVGHPVVMENAMESLKVRFNHVAESNRNDGVARYLERYFGLG
ncbi:MAG: HAD family hydrolase [Fusobacteriaceae bacterium]|jgi:Cof subfamily protein (haloacid dehalogenase superfamily)|nr:HAD family hydrolase [Fusobacteriaceae bacterium]